MTRSIRANQAWIAFTFGLAMAGNAVAGSRGQKNQTSKPMTRERTEEVMGAYIDALELYREEAEFDFASPHWDGQYDSLYSWGQDLIVTFGVHIWGGNAAHLLCKVEQDNLQPIKLTDAGFSDVYELMEAHKITPHDNRNNSLTVGDLSWHYANNAFADGYLYSVATVRWRDLQLRNDIVVVKNVHTGHVSWFCPKVPDSYVEGVTVPHWDPYWDRLKST